MPRKIRPRQLDGVRNAGREYQAGAPAVAADPLRGGARLGYSTN